MGLVGWIWTAVVSLVFGVLFFGGLVLASEPAKDVAQASIRSEALPGAVTVFDLAGYRCFVWQNMRGMSAGAGSLHCEIDSRATQDFRVVYEVNK